LATQVFLNCYCRNQSGFFVKTSGGFCKLATQEFFQIVIFATKVVFLLNYHHNRITRLISQPEKETDMLFNKYALVECFSHT